MPSLPEKRIFNLIGSFYDNAVQAGSARWLDTCREMADLLKSRSGGFCAFDDRDMSFRVIETTCDLVLLDEYNEHYQFINPLHDAITTLHAGGRMNRQEHVDDNKFRKLEIYRDYYRRVEHFHFEYRTFLRYGNSSAGMIFARSEGQSNFTIKETAAMTYLMPHLARAFRLHFNLLDADRQKTVITEAFDRIPQGVIIVDRYRKLVFANERASALLNEGDGLRVDASGIVKTSAPNSHVDRLIYNIFDQQAFEPDKYGGVAAVTRPDGLQPLELLISPFKHNDIHGTGSETMAMIFVTDPEQRTPDVAEILVKFYGLTRTEARLAALLGEGKKLTEICEELDISINTVRTHLKHVFSKTQTNRQSELVKLILSGPANLSSKSRE